VLADGRYDAYIRQVNTRGDYLVGLCQVCV
jgi:hypothetical protein